MSLWKWYVYEKRQLEKDAQRAANKTASQAAEQIENTLRELPRLANSIAEELYNGKLADLQVEDRLKRELGTNPELGAITVCYTPSDIPDFTKKQGKDRFCPYSYRHPKGNILIYNIEDSYDYTLSDGTIGPDGSPIRTDWYHRPLIEGPVWGEPYFGSGTSDYWAGYGTPFYRRDKETKEKTVAGIVDISLTLDKFQNLISAVDLGKPGAGYGFIISKNGTFIYHPLDEFVEEKRTISDFDPSININNLSTAPESNEIRVSHVDKMSGRSSWIYFSKIPSSGWWVGIVIDKAAVSRCGMLTGRDRKQLISIVLGTLAFLFFLAALLFRAHKGTNFGLWAISIVFSILCFSGIGFIWALNITIPSSEDARDILLVDRAVSAKIAGDYGRHIKDMVCIPTGVVVLSMAFTSAHEILFTGYIWQKYSDEMPKWINPSVKKPGFVLPQETGWKMVNRAYEKKEGFRCVYGWHVRAVLREKFDYSLYPFQRKDILLRIWPRDFDRNVILTPDLISYTTTTPESLPGADPDFFIEGWDIDRIFFSYRETNYETNFGINDSLMQKKTPELYYHVSVTKQFIDAFISHIIPISVVIILLFAVLMIATLHKERIKFYGFSTATVLSYCAALFFVTIVSHINLRSGLEAPEGIIYMEYLYFLVYGAILSVSMNSILFGSNIRIIIIHYRDNIIMKLIFWPLFSGILLLVTVITFF